MSIKFYESSFYETEEHEVPSKSVLKADLAVAICNNLMYVATGLIEVLPCLSQSEFPRI